MSNSIKTYYPIIIPTLNRYEHFKRCVESLARNTHADKTELVIGLDYPPSEKYRDGYVKIKEYIPTISGFKKVTVFERDENYGPVKNWYSLRDYVYESYDALISTEDDNEFSPCFLDFMNKALEKYSEDNTITTISAYNYPHMYNQEGNGAYLRPIVAAWGYGCWKEKDILYEQYLNRVFFLKALKSWKKSMKVFMTSPAVLSMLMGMVKRDVIWGDVAQSVINIMQGTFQLSPSVSLVRNMGHDGSGEHCGDYANDNYAKQIISNEHTFVFDGLNSPHSWRNRYNIHICMMSNNPIKRLVVTLMILFRYLKASYK